MELTTLGEIINLQRGYDLTESQRRPGTVPVVGSAGVHGFHDTAKAKGPGVALGRSGASFGKVSYVREDYWPHNTTIFVTDFRGNNPTFVRYLLESLDFSSLNSGSAQQSLNRNYVYTVQAPKFPLTIQRHIAGILSAYDDLIENNQRRIKILEEMARRIYREWFVHFRFPGHEDCRMVESPLGEIPEGWEVASFGDLATLVRNGTNPSQCPNEEFDHFSIPAYDNGMQPVVEKGSSILSIKHLISGPAILLSKLNPRIPRVWLPVLNSKRRAITSTEFLCLKPRLGITQEFLYAKCSSEEFAGKFGSLAIGTSTSHQRVKPESLLALPSSVPDPFIIERFTNVATPILTASQKLRLQIQNLRRTRDLLLPRLLSGQIDVESLPEPVLLES